MSLSQFFGTYTLSHFYLFDISDNYSKFELPIAEGVNKIYISIDIDEVCAT